MVPKKSQPAPGSEPTLNTRGFLNMKKLTFFYVILVTSGSLKMWVTQDYHSCCLYNCSKGESPEL